MNSETDFREITRSFWKIHILHHAARHPIIGNWMLEELREHGYRISPGTLYPLLERLRERGWLEPAEAHAGTTHRARPLAITPKGRDALTKIRAMLAELSGEVSE